ncbi:MAG: type II toxin-antitoxin system VapC family toxin [Solirubrobacterales bacterium]|nr:type II toxin-antitoxin system VapC family toxin [Solirubrobacterales bacterium]
MPDYLDTSAFIKLVRSEPESHALRHELEGRELISSSLLIVEGRRAARRYGELASRRARVALTAITIIALDAPILDAAAELDPAELRSLDALHLASILSLGGHLERLYCYDARLTDAAQAAGIEVSQPN